jgi:hypothetical protein
MELELEYIADDTYHMVAHNIWGSTCLCEVVIEGEDEDYQIHINEIGLPLSKSLKDNYRKMFLKHIGF